MTDIRIFVNESGEAGFLCPKCGADNRLEVPDDDAGLVETPVRCDCGFRGRALVDKRRAPRMTVTLAGEVSKDESRSRPITVRVLSRLGLGFKAPENSNIRVGDEVGVELFLEDVGAAVIRKKAVVRDVSGDFVGAEFLSRNPPSTYDKICDRALTVYLQGGDPDGY